jgi:hypothetical protein
MPDPENLLITHGWTPFVKGVLISIGIFVLALAMRRLVKKRWSRWLRFIFLFLVWLVGLMAQPFMIGNACIPGIAEWISLPFLQVVLNGYHYDQIRLATPTMSIEECSQYALKLSWLLALGTWIYVSSLVFLWRSLRGQSVEQTPT